MSKNHELGSGRSLSHSVGTGVGSDASGCSNQLGDDDLFVYGKLTRVADCVFALFVIITTIPLMLVIYFALRFEFHGSPLVMSRVRSASGQSAAVLRFRTQIREGAGQSRVGKFLVGGGLDRLPSLLSVLNGDLTVFGHASLLPGWFDRYELPKKELAFRLYPNFFKRILDVIFVILASPMIITVVAVLYIVVRSDGGPGFFGQHRVGRHGREFVCWKIRTMQTNASEMLRVHLDSNPDAAKEWEENRKLTDDPRITKIGNLLRKTSLDEFPQFWNVFKGEMSIVGPRPVPADELRMYGTKDTIYKSVRPGITGLWQVSGRNDISYEERVVLDETYTRSVSFFGDLVIMCKTFDSMLKRTGG